MLSLNHTEVLNEIPRYFILSNGDLSVFVNSYGGGNIKLTNGVVTSRRTNSRDGIYFYIKDKESGLLWSSTVWPTNITPDSYNIFFDGNIVRYTLVYNEIECNTEYNISEKDNILVIKLTLKNLSQNSRNLDLTSYTDVVILDDNRKDLDHQQFFNLFVESEFNEETNSLIFKRRTYSAKKPFPNMFYKLISDKVNYSSFETNRKNFIGRLRSIENPIGVDKELSNFYGDVLDPIAGYKVHVSLKPEEEIEFYNLIGANCDFNKLISSARSYTSKSDIEKVYREKVDPDMEKKIMYQVVASKMFAGNTESVEIKKKLPHLSGKVDSLWKHRISGDVPILLVSVDSEVTEENIGEFIKCQLYLHTVGFEMDLVYLNELENKGDEINGMIRNNMAKYNSESKFNIKNGVFFLDKTTMEEKDYLYLKHFSQLIDYTSTSKLLK
jgi:cyclic beta-1,2-glucan synthetase